MKNQWAETRQTKFRQAPGRRQNLPTWTSWLPIWIPLSRSVWWSCRQVHVAHRRAWSWWKCVLCLGHPLLVWWVFEMQLVSCKWTCKTNDPGGRCVGEKNTNAYAKEKTIITTDPLKWWSVRWKTWTGAKCWSLIGRYPVAFLLQLSDTRWLPGKRQSPKWPVTLMA